MMIAPDFIMGNFLIADQSKAPQINSE